MRRRGTVRPRRTKIVCTLGPASSSGATIAKLVRAGMDCARLNFSHGSPQEHLKMMERVRRASRAAGRLVAVMQDLPGPKLRVGELSGGSVKLVKGAVVTLTARRGGTDGSRIPVQSRELPGLVKTGHEIFLSDGSIKLRVLERSDTDVTCRCEIGGTLLSGKGINIPGPTSLETFTQRDRGYLAIGLEHGIDFVAVSFVRTAHDIREVREFVRRRGDAAIVAKIEKKEAVDNLDEIIGAADAVMVARGDMGVENPIERVPELQKEIISRCRSNAVPVITATQMLESMVRNAGPTRAEVTDVANAIIDGTDAVMLSEETSIGEYPVECVRVMDRVALRAEEMMLDPKRPGWLDAFQRETPADALSESACRIAQDMERSAIAIQSEDERILSRVSRFRPRSPILFVSRREERLRRSQIIWGIHQVEAGGSPPGSSGALARLLLERAAVSAGDGLVTIREARHPLEKPGLTLSVSTAGWKR